MAYTLKRRSIFSIHTLCNHFSLSRWSSPSLVKLVRHLLLFLVPHSLTHLHPFILPTLFLFPSQPLLLSPHLIHNHHLSPSSSLIISPLSSSLQVSSFFSAFVTSCDVTFHQLFFPFLLLLFSILASITFFFPPFLPSSSLTLNFPLHPSLARSSTYTDFSNIPITDCQARE